MLREKIGLSPEGGYTKEAAEKLYLYGRNHWRTGRGYLYSDNNPEVLFDAGYKEHVTVVTYTVWQEIGLDVDYLRENDHIIWTKIDTDPSKVMYDMHGRTTGLDEYKNSPLPAIWRMMTAYSNAKMQENEDRYRSGAPLFRSHKAWQEEMHRYYEQGKLPPAKLMFDEPTILDNLKVRADLDIQKWGWALASEIAYTIDWELTWYLMMHSLSEYAGPVIIEEGVSNLFDSIIEKFKTSEYLLEKISVFVKTKTDSFSKEWVVHLDFERYHSWDLFVSLHGCELYIAGEKNEDSTWNLEIEITDTFDFALKNPFIQKVTRENEFGEDETYERIASFGYMLAWSANDVAYASQEMGEITSFPVTIRFTMKNYKIE